MIKKIIGIADVHIPNNSKGLDDLKGVAETFYSQVRKIVKEAGGPENVRIVVGGDLFDMKLDITNEGLLAGHEFLQALDKICPTIVIAGNHDLNLQNLSKIDSITPIFEMSTFKQTRYLDMELGYKSGFVKDDNVVWCLYSTFSSFEKPEFMPDKETNPDKSVKYIGLIHGEINGATTNNNMVSENALSVSLFDGTDFVLAGGFGAHGNWIVQKPFQEVRSCIARVSQSQKELWYPQGDDDGDDVTLWSIVYAPGKQWADFYFREDFKNGYRLFLHPEINNKKHKFVSDTPVIYVD